MKVITSINNPLIKDLTKLKQKKYRDIEKRFLVEGYHLVNEAKKYLDLVLITNEKDLISGVENILVNEEIIKKLSFTTTPQNIIGVCHYFEDDRVVGDKVLILDNLQDPGNIGTLIRSSLGFNMSSVILSNDSVDIYNDKLIRSTQGAIFQINVVCCDIKVVIDELKKKGIKVYGTSLSNGKPLGKFEKVEKYAIVLGNEGNGVREEILKMCDDNIFIEMDRRLESLNVAISGAIIMHYFYF